MAENICVNEPGPEDGAGGGVNKGEEDGGAAAGAAKDGGAGGTGALAKGGVLGCVLKIFVNSPGVCDDGAENAGAGGAAGTAGVAGTAGATGVEVHGPGSAAGLGGAVLKMRVNSPGPDAAWPEKTGAAEAGGPGGAGGGAETAGNAGGVGTAVNGGGVAGAADASGVRSA